VAILGSRRLPAYRRRAVAALLLTCAVTVCSCTGREAASQPQGATGGGRGRGGEGPVPVLTTVAVTKAVPISVAAVGSAEAISSVQVRSQITGRLAGVHFNEGEEVRAGQPLFTIDPQPFQVALDQATAVLARDTAQANNAQAQVERFENLFQRGLIPRDQYETQMATAAALKATTAADQAAVAAARLNLQYSNIAAPASGRTGALLVHEGDLVQANGSTPLVIINQLSPVYVTFSVPGKMLDEIRRYQRSAPLTVTARTAGSEESSIATGRLTFVDNAVDAQTGTIKLKGTFANADRSLWPGQSVDVTLLLTTEADAIVVPSVAVQPGQQGTYVWVVEQEQAQMRPVTVARVDGDESIVASGLKVGEVVVTDGQLRLTPGARIATRDGGRTAGAAEAQ
jgi:membrane fusion protein, multidrug efflux system